MFLQKSYQVFNLKMNNIRTIKGGVNLKGKVKVPGDKSISHRALIIGSIAKGETTIEGIQIFIFSQRNSPKSGFSESFPHKRLAFFGEMMCVKFYVGRNYTHRLVTII